MKNIIIFGAGIAGLTVAHELLERGYHVVLYESTDAPGGFARSTRDKNGMPKEHSWRAYGAWYKNLYNIAKRIPINEKYTVDSKRLSVYSNLSGAIILDNHPDKIIDNIKPNFMDSIYIGYPVLQCFLSNKRKKKFKSLSIKKIVEKNLSKVGRDKYIRGIGTILALDPNKTSVEHMSKVVELWLDANNDDKIKGKFKEKSFGEWGVMTKPTSEAWFNPWVNYLNKFKNKFGNTMFTLHLNSELKKYLYFEDTIIGAVVLIKNKKYKTIKIGNKNTIFINCTDPFTFKKIILNSFDLSQINESLLDVISVVEEGVDNQIGFTLEFNKKIFIPSCLTFAFPDSEFNINMYPQDMFFANDPYFDKIKGSFWSGCVVDTRTKGKIFNKKATDLTREQLIMEIIHQTFRSKSLHKIISNNNKFSLDSLHIIKWSIWDEWKSNNGELISTRPKWLSTLKTPEFRPDQKTNFHNLYIAGAYTDTSTKYFIMESAVESGKIVSKHVVTRENLLRHNSNQLKNIALFIHKPPIYIIPFRIVDDLLYMFYLPNIVDMILFLCFILVIYIIYKIKPTLYKKIATLI